MPPIKYFQLRSLEDLSLSSYIQLLKDETGVIFHLRAYETKSMLMKDVSPDNLFKRLEELFVCGVPGILQDIVRQKIVEHLIYNFGSLLNECLEITRTCLSFQLLADRLQTERPVFRGSPGIGGAGGLEEQGASQPQGASSVTRTPPKLCSSNLRYLPLFQQLLIILNSDVKVLDFSKSRDLADTEDTSELCRMLWKIIGERCEKLEKLILTRDLTYSSTLNNVIVKGSRLTHLTLKRNVPNNIFLNLVGQSCPLLQELDIASAEVVNDFGMVCLLYTDPEQLFLKCWNKDKTVGKVRRSMRVFPQPYFDRPIYDQMENCPRGLRHSCSSTFLYLKRLFHEVLRTGDWERLPVANSLRKLRLENTKVKGDGVSVILSSCPNISSLGYLVFAAAGLKQVFGYEETAETKLTEIFYRGPSDLKLHTISNCCPGLNTLFLGSNNPRSINTRIFSTWRSLNYLTLENIVLESVISCFQEIGSQLRGLKLQCAGFNLQDIANLCPNLETLIIQKEPPNPVVKSRGNHGFGSLLILEVSCPQFSKQCMEFILSYATKIESIKILNIPKLVRTDLETWFSTKHLPFLKTLIIFKGPSMNMETTMSILSDLPAISEIGISDLNSIDVPKSPEMRKLLLEIKRRDWDITLADFVDGVDAEERDFAKVQSLHWFHLTQIQDNQCWKSQPF